MLLLLLYIDVSFAHCFTYTYTPPTFQLTKMRAPEELKFGVSSNEHIDRDKADVWCLGNIMYNVLTKQWNFQGISNSQAKNDIIKGKLSSFPSRIANSTDPLDQAMMKAIKMAWTYSVEERPSARVIAEYLKTYIGDTQGGDNYWQVSIPPLPPDYDHSDREFLSNFGVQV